MIGLPRCLYVLTLAGINVCPGCRWTTSLCLSHIAAAAPRVWDAAATEVGQRGWMLEICIYIQQCGTAGRWMGHFKVGPRPLTVNSCNANRSVTGLRTSTTAGTGGDAADSFLPVVMSTRAASASANGTHGVVDIAALEVKHRKTRGGRDIWVGARSAKAEKSTVDEVAIGVADVRVGRDDKVRARVPALEIEQACVMRLRVPSVDKFGGGELIECV
jgi:hypothetical protein